MYIFFFASSRSEKQPNLSSCVLQGIATFPWYVSVVWVGGQPFLFLLHFVTESNRFDF